MKANLEAVFATAMQRLNTTQRSAVETIEGPVMVVAGPGTGKTQILALRIAHIISVTDTKPEQILALTFTESGVRAMRARLVQFIGAAAYQIPIHTFHSFCGELIRRYPDHYDTIIGGTVASEMVKVKIVEDILASGQFAVIRPAGRHDYYVRDILSSIATLKKEFVSPDQFKKAIAESERALSDIERYHTKGAHKGKERSEYTKAAKEITKNRELVTVYDQYCAALKVQQLYDFEDMVLDTIAALKGNEAMLRDLQEQYLYILADEHQDVNQSQNELIALLASYHTNPNVFVVGDEKQAIYRFQGASLDNFLYFSDVYPGAKIIALTDNYRSTQHILDVAHETIKTDDPTLAPLRVPLHASARQEETKVAVAHFSHQAIEDAFLVETIKKHAARKVAYREMAVIVRTNREVEALSALLRKAGLPVAPSSESDVLTHPITAHLQALLRAVVDPTDERALFEVLHASYVHATLRDRQTVLAARSYQVPLMSLIGDEETLQTLGVDPAPFLTLAAVIAEARRRELVETPAMVLEYILTASGFLNSILSEDAFESARVVRRLYDEVERISLTREARSLREVLEYFAVLTRYNLGLTAPFIETNGNAVAIMTAHKAKGLEFEVVCIPRLTDNVWGGKHRKPTFDLPVVKHTVDATVAEDDERKLYYVALTRAKCHLYLFHSDRNHDGGESTPSRFLAAVPVDHVELLDTNDFEKSVVPLEQLMPRKAAVVTPEFLAQVIESRGWSATSLNNYLKSPWEFIYKNALRIPSLKTPELHFGTSVHTVLERTVRHYTTTKAMPSASTIKTWLDDLIGKTTHTAADFTRQHKRAFEAILSYLPHLERSMTEVVQSERRLEAELSTGISTLPTVRLTGELDRLDFDAEGCVVAVTDYKTGKAKTRGEIEGTTKNSDGAYKRQLVFYALLLSLQSDTRMHCRTGRLSFVEADSKGKIREEEFVVTDEEIASLRTTIIEATKALVSGECLTVPCDPEVCDFCHLL